MADPARRARRSPLALALFAALAAAALALAVPAPTRAAPTCPPACTPQSTLLDVDIDAGPDPICVGCLLNYTITITNTSGTVASGVTLQDRLPARALVNVQVQSTQGTCTLAADTVSCTLFTIESGHFAQVAISGNVTAKAGAVLVDQATVQATVGSQRVQVARTARTRVTS